MIKGGSYIGRPLFTGKEFKSSEDKKIKQGKDGFWSIQFKNVDDSYYVKFNNIKRYLRDHPEFRVDYYKGKMVSNDEIFEYIIDTLTEYLVRDMATIFESKTGRIASSVDLSYMSRTFKTPEI